MSNPASNIPAGKRKYPAIRSNIIYSLFLTGVTYLFPLVVYPYVSRVLGVDRIGLVGFIDSLVTYFILFSMMGISILGVRETARHRNDTDALGRSFTALLGVHVVMTALCLVALVAVTLSVERLRCEWQMMGIGACKLIFNTFLVEWLFRGLEDFRYITWRSLVIRGAYVAAVFLMIRNSDDTLLYYALTMGVVAITAVVNMVYASRFVSWRWSAVEFRACIKPFFSLGIYMLLSASYTTLNVVVLGFVTGDQEVGYYSTATKIFSILLAVYSALGMAVMPKISVLANQRKITDLKTFWHKCLLGIFLFAVPVSVAGVIFSPEIVMLLSGPGYEGAITPVRIIFTFFVIFGIGQFTVVGILTPIGSEHLVNRCVWPAAVAGIILNPMLAQRYGAVGSAVVWVGCETLFAILGLVCALEAGHRFIKNASVT